MVQVKILSGKKAGAIWPARRFPVRIGRSAGSDLQLEEHGVWDDHCRIELHPGTGFVLETQPEALITVNGQPAQRAALRNGDLLEIGALKLQFWLSEPRQRGLRIREWFAWIMIAGVSLGEIALIYWLTQ
jgi:pSer/pThr/pTyr-binding forkhead associated (FHA) protein